jgi:drug/metabolite transporter (DMT)-like permease
MVKYLPFILFTVITNAAAQILLKQGMNSIGAFTLSGGSAIAVVSRILFNPYVILGLSTFVVSTASNIFVLSRVDVSFAYPFLSLAYVLVAVWAATFLHETLSATQIAGIGAILVGTILIALK